MMNFWSTLLRNTKWTIQNELWIFIWMKLLLYTNTSKIRLFITDPKSLVYVISSRTPNDVHFSSLFSFLFTELSTNNHNLNNNHYMNNINNNNNNCLWNTTYATANGITRYIARQSKLILQINQKPRSVVCVFVYLKYAKI